MGMPVVLDSYGNIELMPIIPELPKPESLDQLEFATGVLRRLHESAYMGLNESGIRILIEYTMHDLEVSFVENNT